MQFVLLSVDDQSEPCLADIVSCINSRVVPFVVVIHGLLEDRRKMSKKKDIERLIISSKGEQDERFERRAKIAKRTSQTVKGAAIATEVTMVAASTGAVTASSLAAGSATVAMGLSVAAPPFSTLLAVIPAAVAGIAAGVSIRQKRGAKFLNHDVKLIRRLARRYRRRSSSWRKHLVAKYLKEYRKMLKEGNKAKWWAIKKNKQRLNWMRRKAKLEVKLKALYAAEYSTKKRRKRITRKQARAEKKVVRDIRKSQMRSIDPRTSSVEIVAPGELVVPVEEIQNEILSPAMDVPVLQEGILQDIEKEKAKQKKIILGALLIGLPVVGVGLLRK